MCVCVCVRVCVCMCVCVFLIFLSPMSCFKQALHTLLHPSLLGGCQHKVLQKTTGHSYSMADKPTWTVQQGSSSSISRGLHMRSFVTMPSTAPMVVKRACQALTSCNSSLHRTGTSYVGLVFGGVVLECGRAREGAILAYGGAMMSGGGGADRAFLLQVFFQAGQSFVQILQVILHIIHTACVQRCHTLVSEP